MKINLLHEVKSSLEEVVNSLLKQKHGTPWAEKTNHYAIAYAEKLGEVYGDVWYKGSLPEEFFSHILLPKHGHSDKETDDTAFFPSDTAVDNAITEIKNSNKNTKDCLELINYLKENIQIDGFKTSIVLVVINEELKHVDGLHRMIALSMLLKEGHVYTPIPVFLCNSTK